MPAPRKVVRIRPPTAVILSHDQELLARLGWGPSGPECAALLDQLLATDRFVLRLKDDNPQNMAAAYGVSDLPRVFAEPAANGIDAYLALLIKEARAQGHKEPESSAEAVEQLLGIKDARSENLHWKRAAEIAANVRVTLWDGSVPVTRRPGASAAPRITTKYPNAMVRDFGTGVSPEEIRTAILAAFAGHKIGSAWSIGMWGLGQSLLLACCRMYRVVSRRPPAFLAPGEEDVVGLTIVVQRPPTCDRKLSAYFLLCNKDGSIPTIPAAAAKEFDVPAIEADMRRITSVLGDPGPAARKLGRPVDFDLRWFPQDGRPDERDLVSFAPGTQVTLFDFRAERFNKHIWDQRASIFTLLQCVGADLRMPIALYDLMAHNHRFTGNRRFKLVYGMRAALARNWRRADGDKHAIIEHGVECAPVRVDVPVEGGGVIRELVHLSYYVLEQGNDEASWKKRDPYAPPFWAVAFTVNGMAAELIGTEFFIRDKTLRIGALRDHLLVIVQLDAMGALAKESLLSSTREHLRSGPVRDALYVSVLRALAGDRRLAELDAQRAIRALSGTAGGAVRSDGTVTNLIYLLGTSDKRLGEKTSCPRRDPLPPVQPSPGGPTWVQVENSYPVHFRPGGGVRLRVVSDAPDGTVAELMILSPGRIVEVLGPGYFAGGRATFSLVVAKKARPGDAGECTGVLLLRDQRQVPVVDAIRFVVTHTRPNPDPGPDVVTHLVPVPPPNPEIRSVLTTKEAFAVQQWDWGARAKTLFRIYPVAPPHLLTPVIVVHLGYALFANALQATAKTRRWTQREIERRRAEFVQDVGAALYARAYPGIDLPVAVQEMAVLQHITSAGLVADRRAADLIDEAVSMARDMNRDEEEEPDTAPPDADVTSTLA